LVAAEAQFRRVKGYWELPARPGARACHPRGARPARPAVGCRLSAPDRM